MDNPAAALSRIRLLLMLLMRFLAPAAFTRILVARTLTRTENELAVLIRAALADAGLDCPDTDDRGLVHWFADRFGGNAPRAPTRERGLRPAPPCARIRMVQLAQIVVSAEALPLLQKARAPPDIAGNSGSFAALCLAKRGRWRW